METSNKTAYILCGPTAVGKTAISINLARTLDTSIVSADSRQCYKEMTIGTAKPSVEELTAVKHYFVDEFPVTENITAAGYEKLGLQYLHDIFKSRHSAVVCGGTGLYIKALCEGLDDMPETNATINSKVSETYKAHGLVWLQNAVQNEDPAFFEQAEVHNPARLLRALVFIRSTGESITKYRGGGVKARGFRIIKIGLELPREALYDRINHRVDQMMDLGLLKEAEQLYPQRHLKNLQTVGYAELFGYMDGKYALKEAIEKIKQHTRNYAKRQMTWFKKDRTIHWLRADDDQVVDRILET